MKNLVRIILTLVIILTVFGAVMVFTASSTYSAEKFNSIYYLFKSHLWKVIGALTALVIVSMIPYEVYKKHSKYMLLGTILILVLTFFFAQKFKGASRWIDLGLIRFQPSELAKLVLIIHLAAFIERKGELIQDYKKGFRLALVWIIIVCGLIFIQPNASTSMIIALIAFSILFVGGARIKHIFFTAGTAVVTGLGALMLYPHSRSRILSFFDSFKSGGEPNIQVMQAKIGLGSGGFFGVGIGHSRQSDLFLPESYGDFIFSILGEETGFIGTFIVLFIYLALFFIGLIIAKKAPDTFGQLLGFGFSFNIIINAFINAGVVTGLLPTTGITLPFISFGGTSIILFSMSIGVLVNIAKQTLHKQELTLYQV